MAVFLGRRNPTVLSPASAQLALVYAVGAVSGGLTQCAAQWWRAQRVPAWYRSRAMDAAPGGLGGSASLAALAALDIGVNPHARVYLYGAGSGFGAALGRS